VQGRRPVRQLSRATQTLNPVDSTDVRRRTGDPDDRPVPYVVVTAPSPDDGRAEPRGGPAAVTSPGMTTAVRGRARLSAVSYTPPDSATPCNHVDDDDGHLLMGAGRPLNDVQRQQQQQRADDAQVQALLRDLGVEPSSV